MQVGPFQLGHLIGQGGMASVWEGRHPTLQLDVAIKIIKGDRAREEVYRESFARELRSAARLEHPSIIQLYDHGVITAEEAKTAPSGFVVGAPWMAMELARGAPLSRRIPVEAFSDLRTILLEILDALAHAHSRGVVHRDLKPSNILVSEGRLKVSDFGIARLKEELTGKTTMASGTPAYMAPEQVRGRLGEQGPWTDLYGIGCLVYKLVTGAGPFIGTVDDVVEHHLSTPPPPLNMLSSMPKSFERWLGVMLHKDPHKRFRRAADAAYALRHLTPRVDAAAPRPADTRRAPPFTPQWDDHSPNPLTPRPRLGIGLNLYGLRPSPIVGRDDTQAALWSELGSVWSASSPHVCTLHGEAGTGKSRLMEWFAQQAHAMGFAEVLKGRYDPVRRTLDGIAGMIARDLRCQYETPAHLTSRLNKRLRRAHFEGDVDRAARALAEVIHPSALAHAAPDASTNSLYFRYQTVANFLRWRSRTRPALVLIDDAQWGLDAVGLVDYILRHEPGLPVLFVLGIQHSESATLSSSTSWHRMKTSPNLRELSLGPLDRGAHTQLIREVLGVHEDLVHRIAQRTDGLPLFAIQMVGDLVSRGVLQSGPEGYVLRAGSKLRLPSDIQEVWQRRLSQLKAGLGQRVTEPLEVAAALGTYVGRDEWQALCNTLGLALPAALEGDLVERRLAQGHRSGWSFAHGLLRESLEHSARQAGRWHKINLACAALLKAHPPDEGAQERIGLHLYAAESWTDALQPLIEAAALRRAQGSFHRAEWLCSQATAAASQGGVHHLDPRLHEASMGTISDALMQGQFGRSLLALDELERRESVTPLSMVTRASTLSLQGAYTASRAILESPQAQDAAQRDPRMQARINSLLYRAATGAPSAHGDLLHLGAPTLERLVELDDPQATGIHLMLIAAWHSNIADTHRAITEAERAVAFLRHTSSPMLSALSLGLLASFLQDAKRHMEADNLYAQARERLRSMSASGSFVVECHMNVPLTLAGRLDGLEAWAMRARAFMGVPDRRHRSYAVVEAILLVCSSAHGHWGPWREAAERLSALFKHDVWEHYRLMALLERGADIALSAGKKAEARWAYQLAQRCGQGLRREVDSRRLKEKENLAGA